MSVRVCLIIGAHLLLGLLTSVVLALVVSRWQPGPPRAAVSPIWRDGDGLPWMGFGAGGFGWTDVTLFGLGGTVTASPDLLDTVPGWVELPEVPGQRDRRAVRALAAGWPMPMLRAWRHGVGDDAPGPGGVIYTGMGPQRVDWSPWRGAIPVGAGDAVLPRSPLAVGLVVDALTWAGLSALVWLVPIGRRAWRRRRGRCPRCGYAGGAAACPECGRKHAGPSAT